MQCLQVNREMDDLFGKPLSIFSKMPDAFRSLEWELFKQMQLNEEPIPAKFRELIGLGIASATKCKYGIFYHTTLAKLNGATEAEIEDAVRFAKSSVGWGVYMDGMQMDFEQFKQEVLEACRHIKASQVARV